VHSLIRTAALSAAIVFAHLLAFAPQPPAMRAAPQSPASTPPFTRAVRPVAAPPVGDVLTQAASPVTLAPSDHLAGDMRGVATRGQLAFTGSGIRLAAVDVADPGRPRRVGLGPMLAGVVQDLAVDGATAYVVAGRSLYALDIADPADMRVIGQRELGAEVYPGRIVIEEGVLIIYEEGLFQDSWRVWLFRLGDHRRLCRLEQQAKALGYALISNASEPVAVASVS
jgi:hypothetical protein